MIRIQVNNSQTSIAVSRDDLEQTARDVLNSEGISAGELSIAVVDDATIHELNRSHLNHDYPTDVLSFCYNASPTDLDGEVIVSFETAMRAAAVHDQSARQELLLYVIHGVLHLVGFDDQSSSQRQVMRQREQHYLHRLEAYRRDARGEQAPAGSDHQECSS